MDWGKRGRRKAEQEGTPPLGATKGGWTGKTGKEPHEHWSERMFRTGKVPVRRAKAPVRLEPEGGRKYNKDCRLLEEKGAKGAEARPRIARITRMQT